MLAVGSAPSFGYDSTRTRVLWLISAQKGLGWACEGDLRKLTALLVLV